MFLPSEIPQSGRSASFNPSTNPRPLDRQDRIGGDKALYLPCSGSNDGTLADACNGLSVRAKALE